MPFKQSNETKNDVADSMRYALESIAKNNWVKNELEVRTCYTEGQLKLSEKELRKIQDHIKTLEGQLWAYNNLLEQFNKEQNI